MRSQLRAGWLVLLLSFTSSVWAAPPRAQAQDEAREGNSRQQDASGADTPRMMFGVEGAVLFALTDVERARFHAGGALGLTGHLALTKWLAPLARLRVGMLSAGSAPDARDGGIGHLGALELGVRFRPRGIAHPEEPSRASCVWAEVNVGVALWNGEATATFEGAVGFAFLVSALTLGPVVRLVHLLPTTPADTGDVLLMTIGLEVLFNDAR